MKRIAILGAALASLGLAACGSSSSTTPSDPNCKAVPWANNTVPPCTIPVNFTLDDTANGVFTDGEAEWKGQFAYDALTRVSFHDANWTGPYAPLYDDGPWTGYASGNTITYGHEPAGSVAGDHVLGITVFVYPPAAGAAAVTYSYGLNDHAFNDGWIWPSSTNGSITVAPGATAPINAAGATLAAFGTTDLQLTLDTANLEPNTCSPTPCTPAAWDFAGGVKVKGSAWAWYEVATTDVGGVFTFTLSDVAGPKPKPLWHTGLTKTGDTPAFVFVFYAADGTTSKEYKLGLAGPPTTGVTAGTKASGATVWTPATVVKQATGDMNTFITVP